MKWFYHVFVYLKATCFQKQWYGFSQAQEVVTSWDTGVHTDILTNIGIKSVSIPADFVSINNAAPVRGFEKSSL